MARLFCDLDGVLADFDGYYRRIYGEAYAVSEFKHGGQIIWDRITPSFYDDVPMLPDALELWAYIARHQPAILTGIHSRVVNLRCQKRAWVDRLISPAVEVICCKAHEKRAHARPGDVLIDDRPQFKSLWEDAGGVWITHENARDTIAQLRMMSW